MRSSRAASFPQIVDPVLHLVLDQRDRTPSAYLPRRLNGLFRELAQREPERPADDIEDLIWALWISHEDQEAEEIMGEAIEALATGALDEARPLLDRLVETYPDWPEAWNKRATLRFIEKRDAESLADIAAVLRREPRHFAAISGFGQICLRHGYLNEAKAAFQVALAINPHLQGLREIIEDLNPEALMLH